MAFLNEEDGVTPIGFGVLQFENVAEAKKGNSMKKVVMSMWMLLTACGVAQDDDTSEDVELGRVEQALNVTVSGTISYVNHWNPTYSGSNSYFRFESYNGTTKPLTAVKFCLSAGGVDNCVFTNNTTGAYSLSVPTGTYQPKVYFQTGDSRFRLTDGGPSQFTMFAENPQTLQVTQGITWHYVLGGSSWNTLGSALLASTYQAARVWFDTLGTPHQLNNISEWNNMGEIQIRNSTGVTSANSTYINLNSLLSNPTNMVMWHELGHTLEMRLHQLKYGVSAVWPAPSLTGCTTPSGGTSQVSGLAALREGWADFIQDLVEYDEFQGTASCRSNTSTCGVTINTVNPTTMATCGAGSSLRGRQFVKDALMDLRDNSNMVPLGTCFSESTQLSGETIVRAMLDTPYVSGQSGQNYGNSNLVPDEIALLDLLETIENQNPAQHLYKVWANSCFQPGKTTSALTQ